MSFPQIAVASSWFNFLPIMDVVRITGPFRKVNRFYPAGKPASENTITKVKELLFIAWDFAFKLGCFIEISFIFIGKLRWKPFDLRQNYVFLKWAPIFQILPMPELVLFTGSSNRRTDDQKLGFGFIQSIIVQLLATLAVLSIQKTNSFNFLFIKNHSSWKHYFFLCCC